MEYRRKCTVCGKIYCYTDSDVFDNNADKVTAALSGIATVAQLFGGTMLGAYAMSSQRDRYDQRVRDFTRCPYCQSSSTIELTASQWVEEQRLIGDGEAAAQLPQSSKPHIEINANATTESLLKRVHLFLEDSEWDMADAYCDKILDVDPENSLAYLGKLMAETHSNNLDGLNSYNKDFEESGNYKKAVRFADTELKAELSELVKQRDYNRAMMAMVSANSKADYEKAANMFRRLSGFLYADEEAKECLKKAKEAEKIETYAKADSLAKKDDIPNLERAIQAFDSLGNWKDSRERSESCQSRITILQQEALVKKELDEKNKKRTRILTIVGIAAFIIIVGIAVVYSTVIKPAKMYDNAEKLLASGEYDSAISEFISLSVKNYKDSAERVMEAKYAKADSLASSAFKAQAAYYFRLLGDYRDSAERSKALMYSSGIWNTIAAGEGHSVGLLTNGTVVATGDNEGGQCTVSSWNSIVAVAADVDATLGLRSNGTVAYAGDNPYFPKNLTEWKDIIAIDVGRSSITELIGVKADGTLVENGIFIDNKDLKEIKDVIDAKLGDCFIAYLKTDGTVSVVEHSYDLGSLYGNYLIQPKNFENWKEIVAIDANYDHVVGLKADGTVVASGCTKHGECNVGGWTDIIAVAAGNDYTIGLKSDGTVLATGKNVDGQCNVSSWTDIVAIAAGDAHTVGLKADGTVVATGKNKNWQCNVSRWADIMIP